MNNEVQYRFILRTMETDNYRRHHHYLERLKGKKLGHVCLIKQWDKVLSLNFITQHPLKAVNET